MKKLQALLVRWARWPVILVFAVLAQTLLWVFSDALPRNAASVPVLLDTRLWYTASGISPLLAALTPQQRSLIAWQHLSLDVLFPLVYGTLFALLLVKAWPNSRMWQLALAVVSADLMENIFLAALFWMYPAGIATLTPIAALWTAVKWALVLIAVLSMLAGWLLSRRMSE